MKIHGIIHADFEQPGHYATWAQQHGFSMTTTRCYKGETLPRLELFDLLLVLGGPQSPLEMEQYPYLKQEVDYIKQAIQTNKFVIGICLGAQLIAESYGAKTEKSPDREVGFFPIILTEAGKADPMFVGFPNEFLSAHWHNDMPGLTSDAIVLATSQGCPRQIVKFADRVYAFQCHLEFTRDSIVDLIKHCESDLQNDQYIQPKQVLLNHDYGVINDYLDLFLQNVKSKKFFKVDTFHNRD